MKNGCVTLAPRLDFERLINILLKEHEEVRLRLTALRNAIANDDQAEAVELLRKIEDYLRKHVTNEELCVLRLLIHVLTQGTPEMRLESSSNT
ncbi:MAG: hemerythrin domain-containing protein [Thaumarchaeota archaeon]|nr:hemerythrin domain-containing protein [Nitrososphaerota archaeon]